MQIVALVLSYGVVALCTTWATMSYVRGKLSHYQRDIVALRDSIDALLTMVVAMAHRDGMPLPAELFKVRISPNVGQSE